MTQKTSENHGTRPRVVIVGAGFGGLQCARHLKHAPVHVVVVDKSNHHVFQPLLYQVATAGLSPADIAAPIRHVLSKQKNAEVVLAEAKSVDVENRTLELADGSLEYDYLVLATGARPFYFGNDEKWSPLAPGLKTVDDALEIRRRFLLAFEAAEREADPDARRAELTFVVVGGGPTGVELAGTMAELARRAFIRDFRRIDTSTARIFLVEASDRLLAAYSKRLSERARKDLERLGVQVWLNSPVKGIDETGVTVGDDRIKTTNVFWAAGVRATPIAASLGVDLDKGGRVSVRPDLTVEGHPKVFVIGDLAKVTDSKSGQEVPGIAPAAIQMGRFAARVITSEARAGSTKPERPAFHYLDKGMIATIGRARAVGSIRGFSVKGFWAWLLWLVVHIFYLIGYRNRIIVMIQWAWSYFRFERGARLITGERQPEPARAAHGSDRNATPPRAHDSEPAHHA